MKVVKEWSDQDTVGAILCDDQHRLVFDEKAAALIGPTGTVLQQWWKEEPTGAHWDAFMERPDAAQEPTTDAVQQAIFDACHYDDDNPKVAAAGTALVALLV